MTYCPMCERGFPREQWVDLPQPNGSVVRIKKEAYDKLVTLTEVVHRDELIRHAQRRFRCLKARLRSLIQHRARNTAWARLNQHL